MYVLLYVGNQTVLVPLTSIVWTKNTIEINENGSRPSGYQHPSDADTILIVLVENRFNDNSSPVFIMQDGFPWILSANSVW